MKLRIHKNSIRLRLSQPEVEMIADGQSIVEVLEIGANRHDHFSYSLVSVEEAVEIIAEYAGNNLRISFPKQLAESWANSDTVGASRQMEDGPFILIEKDFQCLHKRPGEDESDNFRNPLAG